MGAADLPFGMMDNTPQPPLLGGVRDLFDPIYWHLAQPSQLHPQMTEAQVDECEVPVVAMYLGIRPRDPDDEFGYLTGDLAADAARLNRQRVEAHEAARRAREREALEAANL